MINYSKLKKMTLIAIVDILASLFYFGYLVQEFRITLSVVTLPVLLYIYRELKPLPTVLYVGFISILGRSLFSTFSGYSFLEAFIGSYPELGFYFIYGVLYQYFYYKFKHSEYIYWFISVVLCDFLGNTGEIFVRALVAEGFVIHSEFIMLLLIASVRGGIAFLIIISINYYHLFLKRKEHEERYRRLLVFSSELESEIYYMNMNIDFIEKVMSNSYNLYEKLSKDDNMREESEIALNIAKEVHEVKKNYIGFIGAMEDIMGKRLEKRSMFFSDTAEILGEMLRVYIDKNNLDIDLNLNIKSDIEIKKHYYIMSILRNIMMNAIESIGKDRGRVDLIFERKNDSIFFRVRDSGEGIKNKNLDYIFHPGFSTKFNEDSGEIKRGIGLTLVKDIVEKEFMGEISVISEDRFTEFLIMIPINRGEI